jgi:hypothetical protein
MSHILFEDQDSAKISVTFLAGMLSARSSFPFEKTHRQKSENR